ITLRMGRTEITQNILLGIPSFLRADHHDLMVTDAGETAHHRAVFSKETVAMQLCKISERRPEVIQGERTLCVAGEFDAIPAAEILEDLALGFLELFLHHRDLFLEAD